MLDNGAADAHFRQHFISSFIHIGFVYTNLEYVRIFRLMVICFDRKKEEEKPENVLQIINKQQQHQQQHQQHTIHQL